MQQAAHRIVVRAMACLFGVMLASTHATAQSGPGGTITFIVPYAAGGSADIAARLVGAKLQERLGRSVIIENRPGGSEMVATEAVARSNPDGQTIAILSNAIAINETLVPNRRYDLARDVAPLARVIELPFALMVHPSVPVNSVQELVAYAKTNPGKLNYGHLGPGSPHFFTMEWFKRTAGVDLLAVPYRGAAPAYARLLRVRCTSSPPVSERPHHSWRQSRQRRSPRCRISDQRLGLTCQRSLKRGIRISICDPGWASS